MNTGQFLREAFSPLVDLVYPPRCPLCGEGIERQNGLCARCWGELVIPGEPCCANCRRPLPQSIDGDTAICAPCLADPPRHDGIVAGTIYNDASRRLVLSFKHGGRIALAPMMGGLIAARLPPISPDALIVPVPLHRHRLWHRGYNQAALLARELARRTEAILVVDALVRTKATPTLGGLNKAERKRALSGAVQVRPRRKALVAGRDVILVDDVLTSGATTSACVSALMKAGAGRVKIACFARVLGESVDGGASAQTKRPRSGTSGAT